MIYYRVAVCRRNKVVAEISGTDIDAVLDNIKFWLMQGSGIITAASPLELVVTAENNEPKECGTPSAGGESPAQTNSANSARGVTNGRE